MKRKIIYSVQDWLPIDKILNDGTIKLKKLSYIKIIKIVPINFNLKSSFEKEAILNSYKLFLKTCYFDIQILVQSKKENLSKHILQIQSLNKNEKDEKIIEYSKNYIEYIQEKNQENPSSSKNFYLIISEKYQKNQIDSQTENIILNRLEDKYLKIKEGLLRCGNFIYLIDSKEKVEDVFYSFFQSKENNNYRILSK